MNGAVRVEEVKRLERCEARYRNIGQVVEDYLVLLRLFGGREKRKVQTEREKERDTRGTHTEIRKSRERKELGSMKQREREERERERGERREERERDISRNVDMYIY